MIVAPTQKLYFNKFVYCIKFDLTISRGVGVQDNIFIKQIKKTLKDKGIPHRSRLDWYVQTEAIKINFGVYLSDENSYNELLTKYSKQIAWTSKPISIKHKDLLESKVEVIVREKLLFNRFRYKVLFRTGWRREYSNEIKEWVNSNFEHKIHGKKGDYMLSGSWMITLYLTNDEDLMLTRLCMSEYISHIVQIDTLKDHGVS